MNLLEMKGAWGRWTSHLFHQVIGLGVEPLYRRFVEEVLVEIMSVEETGEALDVGCGTGQVARLCALRFPRWRVTGVDLSVHMVRKAMAGPPIPENLFFQVDDAMRLSFEADRFRLAASVASIKHWPDPVLGLREIHRVLVPGGTMVLLEVNPDCSKASAQRFVEMWRLSLPLARLLGEAYFRHVVARQSFPVTRLVSFLEQSGYVGISTQDVAELPFIVARARKPA